ncbi:hypothetical protein AVEN_218486-1 [Araneus ventricosus]|uniref:Uncharacterized protein n=1 Tax=Araneus ventricosus TaxID=182803 RepID=A0A4Y2RLI1_ARAVE|nr:hypothetical protein AVEN_218486-1 [Araneus ventricosus]
MDNSSSAQDIETSMEYMKFCAYVIDKEMQRFNLDFTVYQSFVAQLPGVLDVNFDIAYNRCAFMYKYTLCNIYFFKDCMNKFILECPEFKNLVSKWTADSNTRLCSFSCGPGLDYLAFMLALSDHLTHPSFKSLTILSKHGAWRNTVGIIADALQEGVLSKCGIGKLVNFKNAEVVQTNLLAYIPMKGLEALQQSSVIFMVKTLNLAAPGTNEEEIIKTKLLGLISSLKPETAIFFIDTKPSLTLFLEVLTKYDGKFLFKPEHLSFRVPVTFSEEYKEKHGCLPVVCSRGAFFVWQKLSSFEPDPNFNISPINPPTDVKEILQNSLKKSSNEDDEVLNITKTLKDLILSNNKKLQPNSVGDVISGSYINDNIRESVSATPSLVNTPQQLEINKSASIQTLFTSQSVQKEHSLIHFDEKSCSSPASKKSSSIDHSFIQGSSLLSFLGESNLVTNYPLYTWTNEETDPKRFSQQIAAEKKISKNKENDNNVPESNQALKPTSESKGTQTDLHQSVSNSSPVKDLTERVKRLVTSLENKVQKNIPDSEMNYHLHGIPNRSTNYSPCSTNSSNNSDVDIKPTCCSGYQTEGDNPTSYCSYAQVNDVHCCAVGHMIHRCEMHCCRSCFHGCHIHPYWPSCENNIVSSGSSLTQPKIVIPFQNISDDMLLQIISAAKSCSKPQ